MGEQKQRSILLRDMEMNNWKERFFIKILLVLLVLLVLLTCHAGKKLSINCAIEVNPHPISHEFSQPGDLIIGGIASQVFLVHETTSFEKQPSQMMIKESL